MQTPEDAAQMLRLRAAGLGIKTIARNMGCSKNTVRRYVRGGGWVAYQAPQRKRTLRGLEPWLAERLQQHRGNIAADLNARHVPGPGRRLDRPSTWSVSALYGTPSASSGILNNELYVGRYVWNRREWIAIRTSRRSGRRACAHVISGA